MAKARKPAEPLLKGLYQFASCKQVISCIANDGKEYTFKYVQSVTNLGELVNISISSFEKMVKYGSLSEYKKITNTSNIVL